MARLRRRAAATRRARGAGTSTLTMDGWEPTSPLMIALSAGLAIATPLMFLVFSRRQAAAPSGAAAEPPPASDKPAYRSAKELRDELSSEGLVEEAGRRKVALTLTRTRTLTLTLILARTLALASLGSLTLTLTLTLTWSSKMSTPST